jgi:hypothetical protein
VKQSDACAHELGITDRIEKQYTLVWLRQIDAQTLLVNTVLVYK